MQAIGVEDIFMTSPSPGQIARYLRNRYYKSDEEYIFALADVMRRAGRVQVDSKIVWLKLQSLTEGAHRASKQLWAKTT